MFLFYIDCNIVLANRELYRELYRKFVPEFVPEKFQIELVDLEDDLK